MPSTDFGSNNKSPGGWGGSGSAAAGGQGGMGGAKSSAGNYNYRGIPGTRAIGNYNTGGPLAGVGNQYGVNQNNGIQRGYPGTAGPTSRYIAQVPLPPPVVQPPAIDPVVAALTPANIALPSAPVMSKYGPRVQGVPPGQYGANNPASGFSLANFNKQGTWGGAQQTTINKSPGGGGYTNINKNGGGYGYSGYGGPR